MADVAAKAGVSPTAVSFVLSGRDDQGISQETEARVLQATRDLGYRPDLAARILRTGTSGTIGLISDHLTSTPYANAAVLGALNAARQHDRLLYISETLGDPKLERRLLEEMVDRRVDGFIYASMFTREVRVPEIARALPLVLLNCVSPGEEFSSVVPDEEAAGRTAAIALVGAGHGSGICFLGELPDDMSGGERWGGAVPLALGSRLRGIRAVLGEMGHDLAPSPTLRDWEPDDGRAAVRQLLDDGVVPTALICVNDRVAMGAYQALHAAGLTVPQDVSVVSFDDSDLAAWLDPPLSSVHLPHDELGRTAVQLLVSPPSHPLVRVVPMPLRMRRSVGQPRRAS